MKDHSRTKARLEHVIQEIALLKELVLENDFASYTASRRTTRAAERALQIISEAMRHVPADLWLAYPHIPYRQICDLGNRLRHEYHNISDQMIWHIMTNALDDLLAAALDLRNRMLHD